MIPPSINEYNSTTYRLRIVIQEHPKLGKEKKKKKRVVAHSISEPSSLQSILTLCPKHSNQVSH